MNASLSGTALAARMLLSAALFAGVAHAAPAQIKVTDAWVRLPAVTDRPGAAYVTITGGPTPDRLVAASSPLAGRTELHAMSITGGVMKMTPLAGVDVPAGGTVSFAPGGNHIMLFGLDPAVKPGTGMPLALRFEKAGIVMVNARTVAAGDAAPMGAMQMEGHAAH
jgi:copper(I)-binding protein